MSANSRLRAPTFTPFGNHLMAHANDLVNAMGLVGYTLADMLPAYPGKDVAYLDHLWSDTAHASDRFVMPYGLLGTQPHSSKYFNVHPGGFRSNGNSQPWPPDPRKINIFFFGCSMTIGFGLEDGHTIPTQMQRGLETAGVDCEVYNFGAGSYTSRHVALRFLDLLDQDVTPDYAIFLGGNNDCILGLRHRTLVGLLDARFQHERRRRRMPLPKAVMDSAINSYRERRESHGRVVRSEEYPEVNTYLTDEGIAHGLGMSTEEMPIDDISDIGVKMAYRVWKGYLDSMALIRSAASRGNTKIMFAWQPVQWFMTTPEQRLLERLFYVYRHMVFCSPVYHWLHAQGFPSLRDDPDFVNLASAGASLPGKLYVDYVHYSPLFCEKIATLLAGELITRKKLSVSV